MGTFYRLGERLVNYIKTSNILNNKTNEVPTCKAVNDAINSIDSRVTTNETSISSINDQLVKNITYSAVNGVSIVFGGIFASGNIIVINGLLHTTSSVSVDSALFNNFKANGQNINIEDGYIGGVGNITYTIKNGTLTTDSVLDANKYYRILGTLYIN